MTQASQWLMASVECDNGAVAHTTPVYLVVNGQPTWNAHRGPGIIEKQREEIDKMTLQMESSKKPHPLKAEILDRLRKAITFYEVLRRKMERSR